ncbi:AraC family transcriptional regulator [Burkholderia anthina]|uniref:helix-turn-helix domain-containing protein n=1 Tax=Burkholderia anthina TaxID=179879 RepID=UPI001CF336D2|nr:AraC family transcriptional regulator [Burkholderia anthina]MCA8094290.1 AraC family transcriptional regulator [Burkholderia anthina]
MADPQLQLHRPAQPERVSIHQIFNVLSHRPFATTRERGWSGITVDLYDPLPDVCERYPALDHHVICYCPYGSARLVQGRDGVTHESLVSAGVSMLMPAGYDSRWEGHASATARLRIPIALVAAAAEQLASRVAPVELRNVFSTRDVVIEHIAQILIAELGRAPHPAQTLIADQLSSALAAHLVRSYNLFEPILPADVPPLGQKEIARVTDYIETHLERPIGLDELAGLVNVSRFHFTRLFKRSTGMTASSFIERCRIRRAQTLILDTDLPLADVALMTGFADQSHFTRRFHRHVGCTPAAFARDCGRRRATRRAGDPGPFTA